MQNSNKKVGTRNWLIFVIVGIIGQLAWSLENMYLNNFIFSFGYENYQSMITLTVALSAITACVTTLVMGGLSDKIGKRKVFICLGYILWGLSTAAFGLVNVKNVTYLFPAVNSAFLASIFVIILDCVMTFFGSTANDAAFNSYVTKNVSKENRGKVEGVLSVLPLMAMLLITVIYSIFINETKAEWDKFFFIIGGAVFVVGVIAIFLVPKDDGIKSKEKYFSLLFEGFKFKVIKQNKMLYWVLLADFIYCAASQIFFPYMMIYFNNTLEIQGTEFLIFMGVVLIVGSLLAVIAGFIMDKTNKYKSMIVISLIYVAGLVGIYFITKGHLILCIIAGVIMMFGYIVLSTAINALIRDHTPKGKEGSFQGIRMIFQVALPMVTGPYIGELIVTKFSNNTFTNDFGVVQKLPPNLIWLVAAFAVLLIYVPVFVLIAKDKASKKLDNKGLLYDQNR